MLNYTMAGRPDRPALVLPLVKPNRGYEGPWSYRRITFSVTRSICENKGARAGRCYTLDNFGEDIVRLTAFRIR